MSTRNVRKTLRKNAWKLVSIKGGHEKWKDKDAERTTIVSTHKKDVPDGLLSQMRRDTGLEGLR